MVWVGAALEAHMSLYDALFTIHSSCFIEHIREEFIISAKKTHLILKQAKNPEVFQKGVRTLH